MNSEPNQGFDVERLKAAVHLGNVEWQRHALERAMERDITRTQALDVLKEGNAIEYYPHDHPLPRALFLGRPQNCPLHVVASFDSEKDLVAIITVYEPSLAYFEPDFKTRRNKHE